MKKMKKYFVILICIILVCCGGCREKNKNGNIEYISDQVKETDEEYTEKELEKIRPELYLLGSGDPGDRYAGFLYSIYPCY